ncbi:MAG: PAS domain S-box protein [Acidobacteria bacterium]|nr:MAG: PAS domain S-box protein [Acidobacteriota bacterium]
MQRKPSSRKPAGSTLAGADADWHRTFDAITDALCLVDLQGKILRCNRTFAASVGRKPEEIVGEECCALIHGGPEHPSEWPLPKVWTTKAHQEAEYVLADRWVRIAADPLFDEAGALVGALHSHADIDERKRTERALRESEERYRTLVAHSPDGIFLVDLKGSFLSVNETICRELGFTETEMLSMSIWDLVPEGQWATHKARLARIVKGESVDDMVEYDVRDKAGSLVSVEVRSVPYMKGGEIVGFQAIARNISGRKRAEQVLRGTEERYRLIAENTADVIWTLDLASRRLTYVSPSVEKLRGYTPEEVMSQPFEATMTPAGRKRVDARLNGALAALAAGDESARTSLIEVEMPTKAGGVVTTEVVATALTGADGRVTSVLGVTRDITERKRAEEALRQEKERFQLLVESAPYAMVIITSDDRFEFISRRFAEIFGYDAADVPNLAAWRALAYPDPAYREEVARAWETDRDANRRGATASGTFTVRCKDGGDKTVVIYSAGLPSGKLLMTCEDITQQRHLEDQLRQSQKMEIVGNLAGGVAHDFNNLLQAMLIGAQLLRDPSHDPVKTAAVVQELEQQINRGAALTRQLLLFSRRETVKPERLDLNVAVRDAAQVMGRLLRANIALTIELAQEALPVEADRGQLQQVLMNLTLNAVDAMPDGGKLMIRTGTVDHAQVWLSVEDTGHGIPGAIRERIFEPFFTTKDPGKGTGLGLSVVHGIVTQHCGRIEIQSAAGKGSTFKVILPRAGSGELSAVAAAPATASELAPGRGERILIVEDEDGARDGLREILTSLGYQVVAVGSGEDAGEIPADPPFDLLLTDLMLPGALGPQLAQGLRDRWPELRVILMSGYTEDEAVRRGVSQGKVRFLQKPFDMATLAREVRVTLDEPPDSEGA